MRKIIFIIAVLSLFGVVGHFEQEDEDSELAVYCDNVRSYTWPDFRNIYKKECKSIDKPVKVAKI